MQNMKQPAHSNQLSLVKSIVSAAEQEQVMTDLAVSDKQPASLSLSDREKLSGMLIELTQSLSSRDILTSGRLLVDAKFLVGHGHFINWLHENFSMSVKTANRLMSIADMVHFYQLDEPALARLKQLDLRSLYELAAKSTPKSVQTEILAELHTRKIDYQLIRERKQLEQQNQQDSGTSQMVSLTRQLNRFETWFAHQIPLLENTSRQLNPESNQTLQKQATRLSEALSRIEAVLDQIQTFQTSALEAKTPRSEESAS